MAEPEVACEDIQMYGMFWHTQPDSFAFTRWLFNHPKVLAERAGIMECKEAVLREGDGTTRSKIGEQERRLTAKIDDALSAAIVTKQGQARADDLAVDANTES